MNETPLANTPSKVRGQITLEDVKKMSDRDLNVELAKLTGWTPAKSTGIVYHGWKKGVNFKTPGGFRWTHDLNAVHEVETILLAQSCINDRNTPFHAYHENLHAICVMPPDTFNKPMQAEHWAICATARQRCEALVLTLSQSARSPQIMTTDKAKGVSNL